MTTTTFNIEKTDPNEKCINCGHSAKFHHYTNGEGITFDCWYMRRIQHDPNNDYSKELEICTCRNYDPEEYEY